MTLERLNELLQAGAITPEEHGNLVRTLFATHTRVSQWAWAAFWIGCLAFLLMLSYTVNGREYTLLSGEAKLFAGLVLSAISLIAYHFAKNEIRENDEVAGLEIAARGQALAIAILVIVVPVFLLLALAA